MRSLRFTAAALLLAAGPAFAQATDSPQSRGSHTATVSELAAVCGVQPNEATYANASGLCRGFLLGFAQYHAVLTRPGTRFRPLFCVPTPPPTGEAAASSFAAWARANPQTGDELAVDGVARWFIATYPCPQVTTRRNRNRDR